MEELVNKLADIELAISVKTASMERATAGADQRIVDVEHNLEVLKEHRAGVAAPFVIGIAEDKRRIEATKAQIIDVWDGEKKTIEFDAGTVKFRTTQKLEIYHPEILIADMFAHLQTGSEMMKYLSGFNKTEVKKYIGVHPQDIDTVELIPTTTVKLELSG